MGQVWLAERSDGRFEGRAAKFVRRNRGGVAAAALVALAALAGTLGIAWQAREARRQRDAAEAQLARATAANDFTAYLLGVAAPTGRRFTVGELRALVSRRARPSRPGGRAARPWSARRGASRVPSRAAAP
jgi:hypothetical protein